MTTKNLIPRGSGEGGIGITDVTWGYGYYDTGNFNKGLFVKGSGIEDVIANTVTQGGLGGEWTKAVNGLDIYYNGGNVGIGTTSPGASLHVNGNDFILGGGHLSSSPQNCLIIAPYGEGVDIGGGDLNVYAGRSTGTGAGGDITFLTSPAGVSSGDVVNAHISRLKITSAGNVGIGTTSPTTKLHVDGIGKFDVPTGGSTLFSWSQGQTTNVNQPVIALVTNEANNQDRVRLDSDGDSWFNGGNVGIGTTSPIHELEVYGFGKIIGITSTHPDTTRITHASLAADTNGWGSIHAYSNVGNSVVQLNSNGNSYLNGGNVGIGTTSPSSRLDVLHFSNTEVASRFNNAGGSSPAAVHIIEDEISANHVGLFVGASDLSSAVLMTKQSNVGIGTTNPSAILDIEDSDLNGYIFKARDSGGTRFVILSGGKVGIGTTDPGANLHIQADNDEIHSSTNRLQRNGATLFTYNTSDVIGSYSQLVLGNRNSSGSMSRIVSELTQSGTSELVFSLTSGSVQNECMRMGADRKVKVNLLASGSDVLTDATGYFTTTSDKRLKNDLGDCEYGLNEVLQVQPKRYTWKDGPKDANPTVGFFAQDVHDFMPEAAPREAIQNEKGEDDYKWGFHSQTIIAALVNATKEQQQLIEDLKSRIETLENK